MTVYTAFYQTVSSSFYAHNILNFGKQASWKNPLLLPVLATLVSVIILLLQLSLFSRRRTSDDTAAEPIHVVNGDTTSYGVSAKFLAYTSIVGGRKALALKLARCLGTCILLILTLVSLFGPEDTREVGQRTLLHSPTVPKIGMSITYGYTSFLAAVLLFPGSWSTIVAWHTHAVLLLVLGVYSYRDIWPLATYQKQPLDIAEGSLLWGKIAVLSFITVAVPLFMPWQYIPVDPKQPMKELNPEQTASLCSFLSYSFIDSVVFEAFRRPHLPHEELPVLPDTDYARHLTSHAFQHLDTFRGARKNRHIAWGLGRIFFWDFAAMTACSTVKTLGKFVSPIAINRLLYYLETDGTNAKIRPWLWVGLLFLGPILTSIFFQTYIYFGTRIVARAQAILTELVFEHSLRVRFKAETSEEEAGGSNPRKKNGSNLVGKINTLVSVDVQKVASAKDFLMIILDVPLEFLFGIIFLYIVLGWSAFIGVASIVGLLPVPGYIAKQMQKIEKNKMEKTDARVQAVTETLGALRMIKMFGWEQRMSDVLKMKRGEELEWIMKDRIIQLVNDLCNGIIPTITTIVTYAAYTLIFKKPLNASKVFSSIAVFEIIRSLLHRTSGVFGQIVKGKVSLDRINAFLEETELLDAFSEETSSEVNIVVPPEHTNDIGFNNAVFTWSKGTDDGTQTPSSRSFKLYVNGRITFKRNSLNLIVGPTGSGKTSILMALLGEMHFRVMPSSIDSWYNLPRNGGVAYAAQESWVQNETIKANILFGSPYDEDRYRKVLRQCALERDLQLFEAGDNTEVGEKGLTLSGGQKARVTLARAVYSSAEIVLLDDILAALDVHTSKHIVNECLRGDLLRGRTVLLVTHNVALTRNIADHVVAVGLDGAVHEVSDISEALALDKAFAVEVENERQEENVEAKVIDGAEKAEEKKPSGKLVMAEEISIGRVSWKSWGLYLKGLGGKAPILFLIGWLGGMVLSTFTNTLSVWFLGYWASQYETHIPAEVDVTWYLSLYSAILLVALVLAAFSSTVLNFGSQRASRTLNANLVDSILTATLRWLDETPAARIITRCTQDIATIDITLPLYLGAVMELIIGICFNLGGPVLFSPIFLLPGVFITFLGIYLGRIYLKAQICVKRELSNARSPVLAHFGAAIAGIVSIRAYGVQGPFRAESLKRLDHYTKVQRTSFNLNRWIGVRIDFIGAAFSTALASYLLTTRRVNASNTGFSLNMSLEFCGLILWLVRLYNELELQSNSLERVQQYLDIEHEPKSTEAGKPPAAWPKSGELLVDCLSARYSKDGPKVLHDLSFHIKSGERVGIVGRTGSGKSSLTLSLLRCILTEGSVYLDGVPTNKVNLDALRSNVTIIPQVPELLSGTLRRNLDPFGQHDDATLNDALRTAGLFSLQADTDENRFTLDTEIAGGGGNLSVGQRQILALARAIVRNSKLLILDEATSAIDHKTDIIIQSTLRNELASDVTVITIAHRLQTIMDADKIMVLDAGYIVEYDSPQVLLQKKGGQFKSMVDSSGDQKALYAVAAQKAGASNSRK